ncbi:hypothetical protein Efla_006973 [Eimeria flavescens]
MQVPQDGITWKKTFGAWTPGGESLGAAKLPKNYNGYKAKHKRRPMKELLKKVTENQSLKINEEGEGGGNECALPLASAVGQGTDPDDETPDTAVVKGAIAAIRKVVYSYKHVFCDKLPSDLPPFRVVDHGITLLPGQTPRKGAAQRVVGEERPGTFQAIRTHMFFPYIRKGVIA